MNTDETYMQMAISEAEKAYKKGEAPVGCVIVHNGKAIAKAHNLRESRKNALSHAEIIAIGKAAKKLNGWRLLDCTLYVTLEPCPMCAGAIINARIPRVVFGAFDPKAGCFGSIHDFTKSGFNHSPVVVSGVLAEESAALLKSFFREKRD